MSLRILATSAATILALAGGALAADQGPVGIITGMRQGVYAATGADLTALDNPDTPLRIIPMLGKGSLQNLDDILHLRGVDAGFVQGDVLTYAWQHQLFPQADLKRIDYIAKLYDEEIHILARPGIDTVADLAGKRVNTDVVGSGSAMTAEILLSAAGVQASVSHLPQAEAVQQLTAGNLDAVIHVGGAPIPLFSTIPEGSNLHFVPVDLTDQLAATYLPAELDHAEYPSLVGPNPVPTIAVGDVLAVFGWQPNTDRYRKVAMFVDALFAHIGDLQQPPHHPKWREVNLAAVMPGWQRFPEAQAWIDHKVAADKLASLAEKQGVPPLTPQQRAVLFEQYQQWLRTQPGSHPQ